MNKIIIIAAVLIAGIVRADTVTDTLTAIEQATGWTAEELANGLAMLDRVYSNDCKTAEGRIRWHGKVVRTTIDKSALTKSNFHEDGYVYTTKFAPGSNLSLGQKLSAEERAKKREAEARKKAERERMKKIQRLDYLQTNEAEEIERLCKLYPPLLAGLLYTNEVNNLTSEVGKPVDATVTPGN